MAELEGVVVVKAQQVVSSLVVWPDAVVADHPYLPGVWVDTGEGGLFAYAVIESPDANLAPHRAQGGCEVGSFLTLSLDDVVVGGVEVTDPQDGGPSLTESVPLLGGIFLGATNQALSRDGFHFAAGEEDLTPTGLALVAALRAAYDAPVTTVTLLDT